MTDLHTHILPGMDDGPKDPQTALRLLELQLRQGVTEIALTSHFDPEGETAADFLGRREAAFGKLKEICPRGLTLKLGCEVYFTPAVLGMDAGQLCLEGTSLLLLELPVLQKPAFLPEVLSGLRNRGITPLIAHAERYQYVRRDPGILAQWKALGAVIQLSSGAMKEDALARKMVKWGLADVLASDAHSPEYRPPNLKEGLNAVRSSCGAEPAGILQRNADLLFSGGAIPNRRVHVPKKVLGLWL